MAIYFERQTVMELQIRQGEITDAEAIQELNAREMGYHYPKDKTEKKLRQLLRSDRDRIFVALADHRVVMPGSMGGSITWTCIIITTGQ